MANLGARLHRGGFLEPDLVSCGRGMMKTTPRLLNVVLWHLGNCQG